MYGQPDVTYRPTLRQLVPQLGVVAAGFVLAGFIGDQTLAAICLLALGIVLLMWRRYGIVVRSDGMVLMAFTNRFVAWPDVLQITEHEQFGGRGLIVVERGGRRTLLKAPRDGRLAPDPDYERKRDHVLETWAST